MSTEDLIARVHELTKLYCAGNEKSFKAVVELFQLLLSSTVMDDGERVIALKGEDPDVRVVTGRQGRPVRLRDGRYLRVWATCRLEPHDDGGMRLKVKDSSFQYQEHDDIHVLGEIFRYDYTRLPGSGSHPLAHLNVHGTLDSRTVLDKKQPLSRVHFPTARVSIEGVIRCLADQFNVPVRDGGVDWRALLAAAEKDFLAIAHQPLSGPALALGDA